MFPKLLELGPITVYTYGVLLAAAYLLGLKLATTRAAQRGLGREQASIRGVRDRLRKSLDRIRACGSTRQIGARHTQAP